MEDYLQPMSRPVRLAAIVALGATVLVLVAIELLLAATPFIGRGYKPEDGPTLLGIFALFGTFLVACSWMLVRLLRDTRATNGVTILPLWFIQLFGLVFLAGGGFAAFQGEWLDVVGALPVGLAMVAIGRSFRQTPQRPSGHR